MGPIEISLFMLMSWLSRVVRTVLLLSPAAVGPAAHAEALQEPAPEIVPGPLLFTPAPGLASVAVPRIERLVYKVRVGLSVAEATVGTVTQTCTVAPQEVSVMLAKAEAPRGEAASIKLEADGGYFWYKLRSTLETRILPQDFPRLYYYQESNSSRGQRRREVMLGTKEGAPVSTYRGDTSKNAPAGTRIWKAEKQRAVPAGTIDMLTAILMARTLVREEKRTLEFPLIDAERVWLLVLRRGEERRIETGAGEFDAVKVVLDPRPYPGEDVGEKAKQFAGVFGIHGSIELWVEKRTGIAVRIQGDLPIDDGLITLGIDVLLESYDHTPPEFAPIARR